MFTVIHLSIHTYLMQFLIPLIVSYKYLFTTMIKINIEVDTVPKKGSNPEATFFTFFIV